MKYKYDLHIHSALSPCADNQMTPVNIVGYAKLLGLDFVAISDHNAIENVEVAIKAGNKFGIKVVPAIELQTIEEIHILCLFENFKKLKAFYECLEFIEIKNRKDIFGEQLIFDEEDNVVGEIENLLLISSKISSENVVELAEKYDGVAIPAHIDREMNGMLNILGTINTNFNAIELSSNADNKKIEKWEKEFNILIDSDAHCLNEISTKGEIELEEYSIKALLNKLEQKKRKL